MIDTALWRLRWNKLFWVLRQPERRQLLLRRAAASLEHSELLAGQTFATVIDVGANVGQFALFALDQLEPTRVVCIEPQPTQLDYLATLGLARGCAIEVITAALGDHEGTESLQITRATDSSSLLAPSKGARETNHGLRVISTLEVPLLSGDSILLDYTINHPVLLKIDVQGTELSVLRGMRNFIRQVDAVLVEVSFSNLYNDQARPHEVVELLVASGFVLEGIAHVPGGSCGWHLSQADLLFRRPDVG